MSITGNETTGRSREARLIKMKVVVTLLLAEFSSGDTEKIVSKLDTEKLFRIQEEWERLDSIAASEEVKP